MGSDDVVCITEEDMKPFAGNSVDWDCRKMVLFCKDYECLPLLERSDFLGE